MDISKSGVVGVLLLAGACVSAAAEEKAKGGAAPAHAAVPAQPQQHAPAAAPAQQQHAPAAAPAQQHAPAAAAAATAGQHAAGAPAAGGTAAHGATTTGAAAGAGHAAGAASAGGNKITTSNPTGAKTGGEAGKAGGEAGRAGGSEAKGETKGETKGSGTAARTSTETKGELGKAVASGGTRPGATKTSFPEHAAAPAGSHERHAANGAAVRTRADGSRSDVHDPAHGVDIHHGLDGHDRVVTERPDHSRIVAEGGGRGYVQHPYVFHGQEFGHRTFYDHGHAYDHFYGRYPYHGGYLDVYAPVRYYPYGFYGYYYAPWAVAVPYAWGWRAAPWYGFYGAYYAPYTVYAGPSLWLADFVIAATLAAAYVAVSSASADPYQSPWTATSLALRDASGRFADLLVGPAAAAGAPLLTPLVKQQVSEEVALQLRVEEAESKAAAAGQNFDPATSSIAHILADGRPHVFVAGSSLDLVAASGQECAISPGDVVGVTGPLPADADTASAVVAASKGTGKECAMATPVSVAVSDLQEMQNHLREQVDAGLAELKGKAGKEGLPAAPAAAEADATPAAFTAGAPAPDASAATDIANENKEAKAAESDATASVAAAPAAAEAPAANSGAPATIGIGQTPDQVTGALGNPSKVIDLGAKKIYVYKDMKVIFQNGAVSDVQ